MKPISDVRVPLVDLAWQHAEIADEVRRGWQSVLDRAAFIGGEEVGRFETEYAGHEGVACCVGVGNGTDALELTLRAVGVGPGDEVIVPANTFVATALAVVRAGANPVLVDCDDSYLLIDVDIAATRVGPRTKAIVPVHLFGQLAPMESVGSLAESAGLAVVEDAAQSQGARRGGRAGGSFGEAAGTSFYPGKNLGAYGDAGAVLTASPELAARVRALGGYGAERRYEHSVIGFNSRLDTLQAVVLSAKLRRLDEWNALRRAAAAVYDELLVGFDQVRLPQTAPDNLHVWHQYVVRVPRRDGVLASMRAAGIEAGVHYPVPLHLQGAFAYLGHTTGDFPVAEAAAASMISLPVYPGITRDLQERVIEELVGALR